MKPLFICTGFLLLLLTACKNPNTPEQTAIKFLNSMYTYDFEGAKNISTKSTWNMLNILEAKTQDISDEVKSANIGKLKVKILDSRKESDSTFIIFYSAEPDFQPFPALRVQKFVDEYEKVTYKVDVSSLDSLSGIDDAVIEEEIMPIQEDTVSATLD